MNTRYPPSPLVLIPLDIKTPCYDEMWNEMAKITPKEADYPIWTYYAPAKTVFLTGHYNSRCIFDQHTTHWKPARVILPKAPDEVPIVTSDNLDEACLAAWRAQTPDYSPDEAPPDTFVAAYREKMRMMEIYQIEVTNKVLKQMEEGSIGFRA